MIPKAALKKYISLKQKKFRDQYGQYITEGLKVTEEALRSEHAVLTVLIQGSVAQDDRIKEVMKLASRDGVPVEVLKDGEFAKISSLENPQGVLAVIEKYRDSYVDADASYLLLDAIKDPGNLGTIIRSADWFGVTNIIIGRDSVDIYNPKVIQATMGSLFRCNIIQDQDLPAFVEQLRVQAYYIVATTLHGDHDDSFLQNDKLALIIGNETNGVDPALIEAAHAQYTIPGAANAESLNVSVAAGIMLYKIRAGR